MSARGFMEIETPLLMLLLAMLALRCWVAGRMDFETDEAYYWLWSRHLAAGYFDHPPAIAFLIRFGTAIFGDKDRAAAIGRMREELKRATMKP